MLTRRVHRRSVEHVTPGRNAMKDLEIERITVYVVGPETEWHAWAVDMHTQEAATIYKFEETGRS
jgi:hypothetical protein